MAFIVLYPAVAMLAMFIVLVIILILRCGGRVGLRHHALPDDQDLRDQTYDQKVSYAWGGDFYGLFLYKIFLYKYFYKKRTTDWKPNVLKFSNFFSLSL